MAQRIMREATPEVVVLGLPLSSRCFLDLEVQIFVYFPPSDSLHNANDSSATGSPLPVFFSFSDIVTAARFSTTFSSIAFFSAAFLF